MRGAVSIVGPGASFGVPCPGVFVFVVVDASVSVKLKVSPRLSVSLSDARNAFIAAKILFPPAKLR